MRLRLVAAIVTVLAIIGGCSAMATAQNPLVYVSFITGASSGGTNIYEITPGGQQIIGTLGKGGGGPVAVDSQENVYVIEADYGSNGYQVDSPVYMYTSGSKTGELLFTAKELGAEAMTVASDGTVFIAGQIPNSSAFSVVKFAPPNYSADVLRTIHDPRYPVGISVDATGNLYVGWSIDSTNVYVPCYSGCIEELPAGQNTWQIRLPDLAADEIAGGPFAASDGSLIFWTGNNPFFNYIETVPAGANYPTAVIQFPPQVCSSYCAGGSIAFNGGGTELWLTNSGFGAGLGTEVEEIDYPSGKVALKFPVNKPSDLVFISGIAVSPAYVP
jgi:hypothetical protein